MDRSNTLGKGLRWGLAGLVLTMACGRAPLQVNKTYHGLEALHAQPLEPGADVALKLVGDGSLPKLELTYGQLPDGLELASDGYLRGVPRTPGQYERFTISASTPRGEPLGTRSYTLAVGVAGSSLQQPIMPGRTNDSLSFDGITWNSPLKSAYAWDAQLNLLWPLRAGGSLSGQTMAPAGSSLSLVVTGNSGAGAFDLAVPSMDARVGTLAALTWKGDADFDLVLVPEPAMNGRIVTEETTTFDVDGTWMARHEISSSSNPGPEVVSLAKNAPAGRYALVAMKVSGGDVRTHLWLSARQRDGTVLVEQDFDSLFSDVATGALPAEMASGRQSYRPLGLITINADGSATYTSPVDSPDLFEGDEVYQ